MRNKTKPRGEISWRKEKKEIGKRRRKEEKEDEERERKRTKGRKKKP